MTTFKTIPRYAQSDFPIGFRIAATSVGIKKTKLPDMCLIHSDFPAVASGVFTTNLFQAAPVELHMINRSLYQNMC